MKTEDATDSLKRQGCRITACRRAMIEILFGSDCRPMSVLDVEAALRTKKLRVDKSTVYRELSFLCERGLARMMELRGGQAYFEAVTGDHHHHLVCTKCKTVSEISAGNLEASIRRFVNRIRKAERFVVADHRVEFFGLCRKCALGK